MGPSTRDLDRCLALGAGEEGAVRGGGVTEPSSRGAKDFAADRSRDWHLIPACSTPVSGRRGMKRTTKAVAAWRGDGDGGRAEPGNCRDYRDAVRETPFGPATGSPMDTASKRSWTSMSRRFRAPFTPTEPSAPRGIKRVARATAQAGRPRTSMREPSSPFECARSRTEPGRAESCATRRLTNVPVVGRGLAQSRASIDEGFAQRRPGPGQCGRDFRCLTGSSQRALSITTLERPGRRTPATSRESELDELRTRPAPSGSECHPCACC